ncbi:MAG: AraC family transcriptional regulator ligand-binding domain-containing protein, partial [Bacteroidota bacterium]
MEDYKKNFILNMLAYAVQKDVLLEQLCKLSGLELQAMKKGSSIEATPKQVNDLWLNASYLSNDPLFGLHFGESLTLAALGIVGQIIQNSRTVGEALTHGAAFVHLLTDLFGMEVTRSSKSFTIRFVPTGKAEKEMAFAFRQMMDLSMVFVLHEVDGLVLEKIKPKSVRTPHAEINPREYERVLRCKAVKKNQEYAMEFDGRYWDEPIITANYELQSLLLQKVAAMRPAGNHQSLKEKIANFLITNTYLSMPTLEEIAANF